MDFLDKSIFIEYTLNKLGLLEGIYHLEEKYNFILGKNFLLNITDESLETHNVAYKIIFDPQNNTYILQTQVFALYEILSSITSLDKSYRFLEQCFDNDEISRKFFFEYLSVELLYGFYRIWKANYKLLFSTFYKEHPHFPLLFPTLMESFSGHPYDPALGKEFLDKVSHWEKNFPEYFSACKDIIIGIYVKCLEKGLDRASYKWGIINLIERMFRKFQNRELEIQFLHGKKHWLAIHKDVQCILGNTVLGSRMLGNKCHYVAGDIEIHITTPSLEIYLALYPKGHARNFLEEIISLWMEASLANTMYGAYKITWKILYTGKTIQACLSGKKSSGEKTGQFRLGHSLWI